MAAMLRLMVLALVICGAPCAAKAKAIFFLCTYDTVVSRDGKKTSEFSLRFIYDELTGKAVIVGNVGMGDVEVVSGNYGFTFIERVPSGAVQTTTITKDGQSVHSRNTMMLENELFPSQYYGRCTVK